MNNIEKEINDFYDALQPKEGETKEDVLAGIIGLKRIDGESNKDLQKRINTHQNMYFNRIVALWFGSN